MMLRRRDKSVVARLAATGHVGIVLPLSRPTEIRKMSVRSIIAGAIFGGLWRLVHKMRFHGYFSTGGSFLFIFFVSNQLR